VQRAHDHKLRMTRTWRQREHDLYMRAMAERQNSLTERLYLLDDGLEALERLADQRDEEAASGETEKNGLSAEQLSLLVARKATTEEEICPICLCEPTVGELCLTLACCHSFCHKCVTQWLTVSSLCPLCKSHALDDGSACVADRPPPHVAPRSPPCQSDFSAPLGASPEVYTSAGARHVARARTPEGSARSPLSAAPPLRLPTATPSPSPPASSRLRPDPARPLTTTVAAAASAAVATPPTISGPTRSPPSSAEAPRRRVSRPPPTRAATRAPPQPRVIGALTSGRAVGCGGATGVAATGVAATGVATTGVSATKAASKAVRHGTCHGLPGPSIRPRASTVQERRPVQRRCSRTDALELEGFAVLPALPRA
jgi:hypothetical protein